MESSRANRAFPFYIDLNEIPLSSPRGGDDDSVVFSADQPSGAAVQVQNVDTRSAVSRGSGDVSLLCSSCELRRRGGEKEWTCLGCLIRQRSGRSVGGNAGSCGSRDMVGVLGLDINAPPPGELELEGFVVDLNEDASVGRRHGQLDSCKIQTGCNSSSHGIAFISSTKYSVFPFKENGFDISKASHATKAIARPRNTASEVYLQSLREYIAERKGTLGVGWNVEFKFVHDRCKTLAVYLGPDGSRFESVTDVACHLGLPSVVHSIDEGNRFALAHKQSNNMLKRKDASVYIQIGSYNQNSNVPRSSFLENGATQNIQDGFPVQFEDFLLISTGHLDSRPSYHSSNQIWPVGYRSSWHDKISGSIFVCDVADGGESGPKFRVQRHPCSMQSFITSSTVLSRPQSRSSSENDKMEKDAPPFFGVGYEDNVSIQMMLEDCSVPSLDNNYDAYTGQRGEYLDVGKLDFSLPASMRNKTFDVTGQGDSIGEFHVEGTSLTSVWEMISQSLVYASHEVYKQHGVVEFCCSHDHCEVDDKQLGDLDSLSKFSCLTAPSNFHRVVHSESEFNKNSKILLKWLEQDRFGLDADFVQEILEQLPSISNCPGYKFLSERKQKSTLQTIGSGFLQSRRKSPMQDDEGLDEYFRPSKRLRKLEEREVRAPCLSGKPFISKLPSHLIGDALQVWDFSLRFSVALGLEDQFSFLELEDELLSPWLDGLHPYANEESDVVGADHSAVYGCAVKPSLANPTCSQYSRCTGLVLAKTHSSLLNVLVKDLLMKVAVYVDPNFDAGESKPRRGRKKDADNLATLKKAKLDMLPVNEVTWPEIARRYILAVLSMEGNLDSTETACRESGKIFHCLRGDGGTLCGALMGAAALEADAVLLAEARRKVYGSVRIGSDIVRIDEKDTDAEWTNDGEVPEWARLLEPVRKLPTNVGARIKKCVNEALDKNPPEWARKVLEHSISKEVYKGNASGPTKRAVISVLEDLNSEHMQSKPEKEKVKNVISLSDLIMKQCQIVLRQSVAADEDRVFCNLLGRTALTPNDNDDEGRLGYPAMVSRPLDFRTIDLRLAAGFYGGSYEAFVDDVREVWNNIYTAYGDQPDLIELAGSISQKFEELYVKEVLSIAQKAVECKENNCLKSEAENESDDLVARVSESSIPKAPWDEGICKICGLDKDDDNVLLCDSCDSEYHTYCLNPPLVRIPEGNWYCPSCVAKKSSSRGFTYNALYVGQCHKKRHKKEFTDKLLEALSELAKAMELKEYWELTLQERIFLMKFLCDEALNSAIFRDHIDQSASVSAELQQKLRSLNSELKLLKVREEFLVANLAKVKNIVGHGGDYGSSAFTSNVCDSKLNGQVIERGARSTTMSGYFRQLDDGSQMNVLMENSYRSTDHLEATCAVSVNDLKSTDAGNNLQYQRTVKDKCRLNNSFHTQCSKRLASLQDGLVHDNICSNLDLQESPEGSSDSLPSTAQVLAEHNSTDSYINCVNQSSNAGDVNSSQALNKQLASLKGEIHSLQDSIALKEAELQNVSVRKDFLGRDSEGTPYWILGTGDSFLQIVANSGVSSQRRISHNFCHSSLENSRQFGILDCYASGDNFGIPNLCQWTTYQSDQDIKALMEWLRDNDARERELKESIFQRVSCKTKHSNLVDGLVQKKKEISTSDSSKGRKCSEPDFLITKAMTVLSKKYGSCKGMDGIEVSKNPGFLGKDLCKGGIYRCLCLEPLWVSRPHCYSCHLTFSSAEELAQHASDKCMANSQVHESSQGIEHPSKCKKMTKSEPCEDKSSDGNGISQASMSRRLANIEELGNEKHSSEPAPIEHLDQQECALNFEEIKRKFIVQSSLKEEVKKIGLIGSNGVPTLIQYRSPYLDHPDLGLFSLTENEVATKATNKEQSNAGPCIPPKTHVIENLPGHAENGLFDDELELGNARSTLVSERNQLSSANVENQLPGINKSLTVRESSARPLVGRDLEILRHLKINLLDMDACLPQEALRASRSHSDRRCIWRTFVKSAATVYEMIQATIVLEDTIKAEYLRNDWWYWSSPSAACKISTLSALALRLYALDSAILYEKHLANEEEIKPECGSAKAASRSSKSSSPISKLLDSDPTENPKPKTRSSKRRKDSGG